MDRQQGANAWLTIGLREGKNREIRRAMEHIGLMVNRLIRVSYGPFQLGNLKPGEVEEVRRKVLRDQLGLDSPAPKSAKSTVCQKTTDQATAKKPLNFPQFSFNLLCGWVYLRQIGDKFIW